MATMEDAAGSAPAGESSMNRGEPEPMAAASAAGVKTEEDYEVDTDDDGEEGRPNKRAKTTGDVDLPAAELVERLLKCDPDEIDAAVKVVDVEKIVANAKSKEDDVGSKLLGKLTSLGEEIKSCASRASQIREDERIAAVRKKKEEEKKRRADEKRRQREAQGCIACGGAVSEGQYKICAGKITFQGQRMRPCSGNAICSGCCEKMDAEGNPKKLRSFGQGRRQNGIGKYVCHGCANGRALRKAVLCNCCDMFACHACAGELIPYVEKCGKGGFWLCKNEECIEDSEEMELGCECDKLVGISGTAVWQQDSKSKKREI